MTFMVNHHGVIYSKDLGEKTAELGPAIQSFDPDPDAGWLPVE